MEWRTVPPPPADITNPYRIRREEPCGWLLLAGGPAPLIATALFATYHSGYAISVYIAACAAVGLVSAAFMPDHTGKDISMEYDD